MPFTKMSYLKMPIIEGEAYDGDAEEALVPVIFRLVGAVGALASTWVVAVASLLRVEAAVVVHCPQYVVVFGIGSKPSLVKEVALGAVIFTSSYRAACGAGTVDLVAGFIINGVRVIRPVERDWQLWK